MSSEKLEIENNMENLIICVGRQLGSGGCEIARMIADNLGCKFYDNELINLAAEKSGFNPKIFESQDENHGVFRTLFGAFSGRLGRVGSIGYNSSISQESLFQIQSEVIFKAAKTENCVFVGRCADYVLREKPGMFSVFITADDDDRVNTVAKRRGCTLDEARKFISRKESQRAAYYNYYTSKKWGAAESYDLCINSSVLGWERTAEFIEQVIKGRFY